MQQNNGGPPHQKHTSDGRRCSGSKYPEPTSGNQDLNLHATGSSSISHTIPCLLDLPMLRPPPYLPQYRRSQFQSVHPTAVLCLPDHPPGVSIGPPAFSVPPPRLPFFQTHQSSQLSGENVGAVQMYGSYRDGNIITPKDDVLTEASGCTSNSRGQNAKGQHIKGKSRGKGYRNHLQQWGDTSGGVAADGGILSEVLNGMPIEYNSSCDDDRSSIHSEASSSARGHTRGNRWNNQRGRGFNRGRGSRNVNIVGGEQQQQYDVIGSSGQSGGRGQRSGRRGPRGGRVNRGKRGANNQSIRPAAAFIGSSTVEANSDSTEFSSDREHGSGRGWEERDGDKVQNDGQPESEAGDVENSDYESSGNALAADEELAVGQTLTQSTKLSKIQRERSRQKWKKELVHERQQSDDSSNMCTDQGKGDSDANFFNMACFADSAGVAVDGTLQPTRMSEHDKTRLLQEKMSCGERQQVIPETDMKAREGACQSDSVASGSVRGQWSHERRSRGRGRVNRGSRGRNQVNRQYHDSFKEDNADHDDDDDTESRDQATMSSTDTAAKQAGNHAQKQRQKTLAEVDIIRILVREHREDEAPFQDVLEAKYLYDKSRTLSFETIDENSAAESTCKQYEIDFGIMKQLNLKTGYKRAICRRPEFHHTGNKTRVVNYHYDETKLPIGESWLPMNTKMEGWTDLIPITADHPQTRHQYSRVCAEFFKTLPKTNYKICKMYHIQNLDLWKKYTDKKKKISTAADVTEQFERYLFHGTPDEQTVRCICHQNFDPRMHGRHGTVYGKGAYFSTTSKYSNSYAKSFEGHQYMFFARVLVGKFAVGKSEYQRPPPLNERWPHGALFDTCVDRVDNPSIYVVFNNDQCYPEFLIDYQEVNRVQDVSRPHTSSSSGPYTQNVSNIRSTGAAGPTPAAYAPLYQGVPSGTSSFASASSTTNSPSPSNPVPPSKPQPKDKGCAVM